MVRLKRLNRLPEDDVINVMHFEGDEVGGIGPEDDRARWDELAPGLASRLATFYQAISVYFAFTVQPDATVTLYDMRDPKPRIPRLVHPFTMGTRSTSTLPGEVASCLSFQAAAEAGQPAARRRGRIYLGPLGTNTGSQLTGSTDFRPTQAFIDAVLAAAKVMATGTGGAARLSIYSPRSDPLGDSGPDLAWNDAVTLSMDNAFDIQRRRGAAPTVKTSLAV